MCSSCWPLSICWYEEYTWRASGIAIQFFPYFWSLSVDSSVFQFLQVSGLADKDPWKKVFRSDPDSGILRLFSSILWSNYIFQSHSRRPHVGILCHSTPLLFSEGEYLLKNLLTSHEFVDKDPKREDVDFGHIYSLEGILGKHLDRQVGDVSLDDWVGRQADPSWDTEIRQKKWPDDPWRVWLDTWGWGSRPPWTRLFR